MKVSVPKGTRDFNSLQIRKREHIFSIIRTVFTTYGFEPLETPAMENLETLSGKYGEEGDQLIFKILNSGNYLEKAMEAGATLSSSRALTPLITEKALRYDLTVPFARYVVQNQHAITFPFRRYQIQPVWRADRPQKGRYREFYQCDADIIGSNSLLNEVDLLGIFSEVFKKLNLRVVIRINNRKILAAMAEAIGEKEKFIDFTVVLDKLDKIGPEKVAEELLAKGISTAAIQKIKPFLQQKPGSTVPAELKSLLAENATGSEGVNEVEFLLGKFSDLYADSPGVRLEFDYTLARGLNYYTGTIFEVKADEGTLTSSLCGGGRYDDLTGIFGLSGVSGVGISFGADRIYDVLEEARKFPEFRPSSSTVLFVNFGASTIAHSQRALHAVRQAGVSAELYPDEVKMKKQFSYASSKGIPLVAIIGEEEAMGNTIMVKDMASGEQQNMSVAALIDAAKKLGQ